MGALVLVALLAAPAMADDATIVGIRVSPDVSKIAIESDSPLSAHKAFVIGNPYRLVMDFPNTALARRLSRIKVDKEPIREIRLGSTASRTRVVIDFGRSPAPPYKIRREGTHLVVSLGRGLPVPRHAVAEKKEKAAPARPSKPRPKPVAKPAENKEKSSLQIKSADVVDGLVVLELTDTKSPTRTCKLVLDVDMEQMKVCRAAHNDGKGRLTCTDLREDATEKRTPEKPAGPVRGPRKAPTAEPSEVPKKARYNWGLPKVESRGPTRSHSSKIGPLHIERFVLTEAVSLRDDL